MSYLGLLVDSTPVVRLFPVEGFVAVLSDSAIVVAISICGRIPVFVVTNFCKISQLISLGEEDSVLVRKERS